MVSTKEIIVPGAVSAAYLFFHHKIKTANTVKDHPIHNSRPACLPVPGQNLAKQSNCLSWKKAI
jgi:hypothetical protein